MPKYAKLSESQLHKNVAEYLRLILNMEYILWTTVENSNQQGGRTGMIKQRNLKLKGLLAGFPDILIMFTLNRQDIKILCIEIKAEDGKLSDEQIIVHEKIKKIGGYVETARSLEEIYLYLNKYKVPLKGDNRLI